jgi:1-acyl-sn-glycerol-3-phosphate acyltransferase
MEVAPSVPAQLVSNGAAAPNGVARRFDYAALDYQRLSEMQRVARAVARAIFAAGSRVKVEGREQIPATGPFIVASNHLCLTDVPLVLTIMERPVILLADEWLRKNRATRWILGDVGHAIFVGGNGEGDEAALQDSLAVLRAGGIIGLSPEGARSATGALAQARSGMAYLALQASVPIVPVAAWGHERLTNSWRRLRRPEVNIRIGPPILLPPGTASAPELQERTEQIMRALAALLPPEYRGAYA